jgi:coenzyme F420 hydrogenase subunit beta
LIDGVIMLDLNPWTLHPEARIATNVREIVSGIGMQYLWAPVLSKLNEAIFEMGLRNLAIVGPPCAAKGVRTLIEAENSRLWPYREAIRFTIARFCNGIYMPEMISELIEKGMGISRNNIRQLTTSISEEVCELTLWDGEVGTIPLTDLDQYTRRGCASCSDFLGLSADIALGRVGAEPEHTAVIVRTTIGEVVVQNAIRFELLKAHSQVDTDALLEAQTLKDRRSRAKAFDDLHILMLEGLENPMKLTKVQKCFVRLYENQQDQKSYRRKVDVGCGGC